MRQFRSRLSIPQIEIPEECVGDAWLSLDSRPLVPGEAEIATKITCAQGGIDTATPVNSICVPRGEVNNDLLQQQAEAGKHAVAGFCRTCPNNPANAGISTAASIENAVA